MVAGREGGAVKALWGCGVHLTEVWLGLEKVALEYLYKTQETERNRFSGSGDTAVLEELLSECFC